MKTINYYPVLKWKKGEQVALRELNEEQKGKIVPIVEIVEDNLSISTFLDEFASFPNPFIVDTIFVDDERTLLSEMLIQAKNKDLQLIPLLYISDIETPDSEIIKNASRIAIAIPVPADFEGPSHNDIFNAISNIEKSPTAVDLILDLGMVTEREEDNKTYELLQSFSTTHTTKLSQFGNIIIRCSSFPTDISSVQSGATESFNRYDIKIFNKFLSDSLKMPYINQLAYSDYGVTKFTESEINFSKLRYGILPKIKYTTKDRYFVLKGKKDYRKGEWILSYKELAQAVVGADYYYGQAFSFGDQQIYDISLPNEKRGNNTNWVTYCANHHIAVVIDELSKIL